jgi:8-oxo-dGTP pyrophosphatase MutT (NUDIX family)
MIYNHPEGLLDANETAQTAALRELKEETGYTVRSYTLYC